MAKEVGHFGKVSWWSGTFTTLCGLTFPTSRSAGWFTPECAACKRIKRGGRK
jgi:hypothetical protein